MDQATKNAIELYREVEKEAVDRVIASGVERLSVGFCKWTVEKNNMRMSKDLHISMPIDGTNHTFIISFDLIKYHVRGESNVIKVQRMAADKIKEELIKEISGVLTERLFRESANTLLL